MTGCIGIDVPPFYEISFIYIHIVAHRHYMVIGLSKGYGARIQGMVTPTALSQNHNLNGFQTRHKLQVDIELALPPSGVTGSLYLAVLFPRLRLSNLLASFWLDLIL